VRFGFCPYLLFAVLEDHKKGIDQGKGQKNNRKEVQILILKIIERRSQNKCDREDPHQIHHDRNKYMHLDIP